VIGDFEALLHAVSSGKGFRMSIVLCNHKPVVEGYDYFDREVWPPSVPPPSMRASSSSPLVPPKLRTRPSGPRPLAFYAGAGISPASAPQQRRCVH